MSAAGEQSAEIEKEGEQKHEVTLDEALKLAQAHHRGGNFAIADRTYRDILRAVPDHYPTVNLLAALLFQRGNIQEAAKYGKIAVTVEPENAGCWSNYAAILSSDARYDEALEAYDQAIGIDPELSESYINKAHTLWLLERYEEAEDVASQATLLAPDKPQAYINLGIALASQNKMKEAEDVWAQVIDLDPESGQAYSNWCNALLVQGELLEAREKGVKATELASQDYQAFNNLGCVLKGLGEHPEALDAFKKATDLKPDYAEGHLNTAKTLMGLERYSEAVVAARYGISFDKDSAAAHIVMSQAQAGLGAYDEARLAAEHAIALEPEEPLHYLTLASILLAKDQHDEADAVLNKALALNPDSPDALLLLAEVRKGLDMLDEAIEALDKAMALYQETPPLLAEKARTLMYASRVEEGLEVMDKALQMWPQNSTLLLTKVELLLTINRKQEAGELLESSREYLDQYPAYYIHLGSYKKYTEDDPDFIKLQSLEPRFSEMGPESKASINFGLFDAYEDIGDYEKAFAHLKKANDAKKEHKPIDVEIFNSAFDKKKSIFTREMLEQYEGVGFESDVPVFIVGMPRSGTTLTEQIISSHPDVYGAGELHDLNNVIRELGPLGFDTAAVMGEGYVRKALARARDMDPKRVTDKMPGNFSNIGLIRCILPQAKIIHCRRNPLDNLLSCYKQNFAVGHYWSYDLEAMASHYAAYRDVMSYWREILPEGSFLEIDYEETVNNFEQQARRLIDYVGLPWDDACLSPHKQKRAVLTASKDQVIRPIYKSSVEAWRRYEKQLQPLVEGLKAHGIEIS
ncbi:MAG: sulfotransferase [Rhodospirillales bacterium]|nr:sulfotransferase [Rhodospirillales bacterium]MCB9996207.1 sulfotransferase [Rhodospirillales bacterium]